MSYSFEEINKRLNEGINRTPEELDKCKRWLIEFATANQLSMKQLDNFCFEDSAWIFEQIFGQEDNYDIR